MGISLIERGCGKAAVPLKMKGLEQEKGAPRCPVEVATVIPFGSSSNDLFRYERTNSESEH
jgi:hypothetical protein